MQHVFETFLTRISRCADSQDFCETMTTATRAFQIPSFAYINFASGSSSDPRIITNYPEAWIDRYQQENYHQIDPVILRMENQVEPFTWPADVAVPNASGEAALLFREASEFGIGRGLTVPIHDRHSKKAAVTFAAATDDVRFEDTARQSQQALQLLATCFHIHARKLQSDNAKIDGVTLTKRELECLLWAMRGKSAGDTAEILGIKRRTVSFHLDNVRRKFEVRTVAQAIAILAASRPDLI